ncbi:MAG: hypothetical protein AAFY82_03410 [Pseudomonadota bacterium]
MRTTRFEEKTTGLELSSGCYYALADLKTPYHGLDIGLYEFGTGVIWQERFALEDFE